jgi:vitamin B12 transporter
MFVPFRVALIATAVLPTFSACAIASELAPVVVTATRQETRANEVLSDVTVINRETIEQIGQGTIVDLLNRQPGMQTVQLGGPGATTDFQLRGTRSDQVKVLIDGVAINSMDPKGSPLRSIPLEDIERIEILRGAAGALYGADAVGGVIQIFTRKPQSGVSGDAYFGAGTNRTQRASASLSIGGEMLSGRIYGSDYYTQNISAIRNATNADADLDAYSNHGVGGSLSFRPVAGHEITFNGMVNSGVVHSDSNSGTGNYNNRTYFYNSVWGVASRDKITDIWTSTLRYGVNVQDDVSYSSATASGRSPLRTENKQLTWQNDIKLPLGSMLALLERQEQTAAPASRFLANTEATLNSAQLGWNARLGSNSWQLGGRHDEHSIFGSKNTYSTTYGYQFTDTWRASVGASSGFRAPTLYQLYATLPGSLLPNPSLQPEASQNREASLIWEKGSHTASLTYYHNRVDNLIDYSSASQRYRNVSQALLEGMTLSYQGKVNDWTLSAVLDLLDAYNTQTGLELSRRAKEKLSLSAGYTWGVLNAGAELIAVGRRYDRDNETFPLGGYTLINLTTSYVVNKTLSLNARLDNLTDKIYTNALTSSNPPATYNTLGRTLFVGARLSFR